MNNLDYKRYLEIALGSSFEIESQVIIMNKILRRKLKILINFCC